MCLSFSLALHNRYGIARAVEITSKEVRRSARNVLRFDVLRRNHDDAVLAERNLVHAVASASVRKVEASLIREQEISPKVAPKVFDADLVRSHDADRSTCVGCLVNTKLALVNAYKTGRAAVAVADWLCIRLLIRRWVLPQSKLGEVPTNL